MYHPLHHWCPQIPWRRLPEAANLAAHHLDRWGEVPWCSGYLFRRRSTPDRPCMIEDIVARLADASPACTPHTGRTAA
jgi:fatty acid desaturase